MKAPHTHIGVSLYYSFSQSLIDEAINTFVQVDWRGGARPRRRRPRAKQKQTPPAPPRAACANPGGGPNDPWAPAPVCLQLGIASDALGISVLSAGFEAGASQPRPRPLLAQPSQAPEGAKW